MPFVDKQPSPMQSLVGAPPGNLYSANLALCTRVNRLMQIGGQKWVESGMRLIENAVAGSAADLARLGQQEAESSTTTAASDAFRRGFERWTVQVQAARRMAVEQQRTLSNGLREAMTTWSKTMNEPLVPNNDLAPLTNAWLVEMTKWTQAWPAVGKAR